MQMVKKICVFLKRALDDFCISRRFSYYYACVRICEQFSNRLGFRKLAQKAWQRKQSWLTEYLSKEFAPVVEVYKDDTEQGTYQENAPIWVCWWTGVETAPDIVKRCVESTFRNAGDHPVRLITEANYRDYLEIPEYMLKKVRAGNMSRAHLADYIRVKLLARYGGLWLDATIFSSQLVPEYCFGSPVFTLKGPVRKIRYVSDMRWVTFCLAGWKGNVFYRFLADAFETYWSRNDYAIDYLFFDDIILMAYENIPAVRLLLDNVPDNNIHRDDLQAAMNAALPASEFWSVIQQDTALYKLSWREKYSEKDSNGGMSVYGYFLNLCKENMIPIVTGENTCDIL